VFGLQTRQYQYDDYPQAIAAYLAKRDPAYTVGQVATANGALPARGWETS
jgi:hypothetical protein